jgi:outer membrane protein
MRKSDLLLGLAVVACVSTAPAFGQTLEDEVRATIATSPILGRERARLEAIREARPIAWSELLPQVSLEGNAVEIDRSEPFLAVNVRDQPEFWVATLRISTQIFSSGRVWASTRQARAQIASAAASYQEAAQNLAIELAVAYGDTRFARAVLDAQEQSLTNLQEQERFARANQREGFLTRTDVAQAEARVAQAHADLARARSSVVEASEAFYRITGRSPGALEAPGALTGLPETMDLALDLAQQHPAILAAIADVDIAEAGVDAAAANGRMRVFLESSNSRFDVIGSSPYTEESEDQVNVRVSVPLFSGGAIRARTRQQRHLRDAANYDLAEVQRRVRERVTVAWAQLDASRQRLEASRARLEAAELASRGVRREQQFGQRSMIDVLNQEQELLSSRIALAQAERDLMISERALAAASGRGHLLLFGAQ